ncbi:Ctr copper transporter [Elsinoe ampelina]|uniref:Copper transport protein n=1 Tax=Elsinoe ampelina TaxID=302913 RepID=A0A6A6GB65_9PEZI|nr:Ctr copper transporter [Elsinoe ampelina]
MAMVFFTSSSTPLYSSAWTPQTVGQYAGTCIFLIVLSMSFRALVAVRCSFSLLWIRYSRYKDIPILYREMDELALKNGARRPWNVNEALARAILDTTLAGVGYLLMIAVMTMNLGYFLSVLGGAFVGSLIWGGWTGGTSQ